MPLPANVTASLIEPFALVTAWLMVMPEPAAAAAKELSTGLDCEEATV